MPPSLAPFQPKADLGEAQHRALPWLSNDGDRRSVQVGLLGTLLIHVLLLFLAPRVINFAGVAQTKAPPLKPKDRTIELPLDMFVPPKPAPKPPPMKFVETNPNAPENVPDKTNNFSDRNQQVAQEKPDANGHNDMPKLEGKKDFQNNQIVSGQLKEPDRAAPAPPAVTPPPKPAAAAAPRREQNPTAGFDKKTGNDASGYASNTAKPTDNTKDIPQKIDGAKDASLTDSTVVTPQIDPRHPQPRKSLAQQHVRPAIFADNPVGTSNVGPIAADARWSNYGVYLQKLMDTVQIEFDKLVEESGVHPNRGTTVEIKFVLNKHGEISKIEYVKPSPGTSDSATRCCTGAIEDRSPYGEWTDDMIATLGPETEMTFMFFYQ